MRETYAVLSHGAIRPASNHVDFPTISDQLVKHCLTVSVHVLGIYTLRDRGTKGHNSERDFLGRFSFHFAIVPSAEALIIGNSRAINLSGVDALTTDTGPVDLAGVDGCFGDAGSVNLSGVDLVTAHMRTIDLSSPVDCRVVDFGAINLPGVDVLTADSGPVDLAGVNGCFGDAGSVNLSGVDLVTAHMRTIDLSSPVDCRVVDFGAINLPGVDVLTADTGPIDLAGVDGCIDDTRTVNLSCNEGRKERRGEGKEPNELSNPSHICDAAKHTTSSERRSLCSMNKRF